MLAFDASSIIHAWDHYPPKQFPGLWRWMAARASGGEFCICEVARDEVKKKMPECHAWLDGHGVARIPITDAAVKKATAVKVMLGIVNDKYNPAGVNENDVLIVASACVKGHRLVSNENRQPDVPKNRAKYKIPLVCDLPGVGVKCISFLELIKESGEVFE